ncbi:MAG: restriction endonuclease subunit S [Cyclobacteriaceae bacterium]|nr:restriction endonuclease subunit S [Cyclobacteriaceae bacterium]
MTATKKQLVPKLRFKEFKGEWETIKLGEICQTFKSGESITSNNIFDSGSYPVYGGNGLRGYTDNFTHDGFYTLIGRQGALCGNINRVYGKSFISEHAIAVSANESSDTEWLAQKLDKMNLNRLSESSAQPGLAVNKLVKIKLNIPTLPEQQKIASFLSAVDEKIQQLTRKKEWLEQYKKGVMQRLFKSSELGLEGLKDDGKMSELGLKGLKDDRINPSIQKSKKSQFRQLRFRDENGKAYPKWEEKRLGEVCESIKSGKSKASDNGVFPLYGSTGIIGGCDEYSHDGIFVLIARVGANAGTINLVEDKFGVSDNTLVLICTQELNVQYVYFYLSFYNLNKLIFGSGQPLITGGQLKELNLSLPSVEEQQKIASFLSSIDTKIESVAHQITQTQTFKKGLLQQMFV